MKKTWVLLFGLFSTVVMAIEPGERLAPWRLLDQFEQPYSLDERLQVLLARDMQGAKLMEVALQGKPKGYLAQRHVLFLADISRMPGPIASLFAVPAMRDYSYRVLLDRQVRVAPRYPAAAATVLWLDRRAGRFLAQRSFTDASALAVALAQVGP